MIENFHKIDALIVDKTGTLTEGCPLFGRVALCGPRVGGTCGVPSAAGSMIYATAQRSDGGQSDPAKAINTENAMNALTSAMDLYAKELLTELDRKRVVK